MTYLSLLNDDLQLIVATLCLRYCFVMKITRLKIKNAKSFKTEQVIEFKNDINIFIGPNAAGKSNLLDILNSYLQFLSPSYFLTEQGRKYQSSCKRENNVFSERHFDNTKEDNEICLHIKYTEGDIHNLRIIKENYGELYTFAQDRFADKGYFGTCFITQDGYTLDHADQLNGKEIEFRSTNGGGPPIAFPTNYLLFFHLAKLLTDQYNQEHDNKLKPLHYLRMYFPPYRSPDVQNLDVQITDRAGQSQVMQSTSGSQAITPMFQQAKSYFSLKLCLLDNDENKFQNDQEVKQLTKYLKMLGFIGFEVQAKDRIENLYSMILTRESGQNIQIENASSGEKEILNILLTIFAFNVNDGIILIDEPELHLHPKWQRILLDLFFVLSKERSIQFFLATHSPHFITPMSIKKTMRIFQKNESSHVVAPGSEQIRHMRSRDIFHMINATNNEKIFFADKVILVEGIVDRIIFNKALMIIQEAVGNREIIEVIDVYGKGNLLKFRDFLRTFEIESFIFADRDYLSQVGSQEIKSLLRAKPNAQSHKDRMMIDNFIEKKKVDEHIYVLKKGNIENYFSVRKDVEAAISIAKDMIKEAIPAEIRENIGLVLGHRRGIT